MRFPGAPKDATYTDEGWLILEDEAWTAEQWALLTPQQRRTETGDVPIIDETAEQEHRRLNRERSRARRRHAAGAE